MIDGVIKFSDIKLGERGRTVYNGIEELAENIADNGLIQPIVLDNNLNLVAGGRRYHALQLLGVTHLYHATTSDPTRPGYVLKGVDEQSLLSNLLGEIAENLSRENLDWRDEMILIVKAYKLANSEANARGIEVLKKDFGAILGCGYHDLKSALAVHDDVLANPKRYEGITSVRGAYAKLLEENARFAERLLSKQLKSTPVSEPAGVAPSARTVDLSSNFIHGNGLTFLADLPSESVDHIVTDPDYAVDVETLAPTVVGAYQGVAHQSVAESLRDLTIFLDQAQRVLKPQGFCIFFYDLDHHEKLQRIAASHDFRVQRWPLVWRKTDYFSNGAPSHNFTKNVEYAMVLRKRNATLVSPQASTVFDCATGDVTKTLGHPFAKPLRLWQWIYGAIATTGQTIVDPFVGCGSSAVAALKCGLQPRGAEIQEDFYHTLLTNLQREYKYLYGKETIFV